MQDFESQLKEIVTAKRLSASKVTKLTEVALKSMKDDVQLVSILYRTHKALPAPSKIHSLYVFDALSRAARHQVNKHDLSAGSSQGNAATFLSKVEGILEGLFQDILSVGKEEFKEKTKKILDIWVKANTFPAQILSSLTKTVKDSEKGAYHYPAMYSLSTFPTYTTPSFFALPGSSCKLKVRTKM
ncbi:uncharacterized protein BT62DRAFT_898140 [Guyanagaster necrorhizus]|uniref:CID domain-containing protein n=1 Tax=Guyanagaster necrorhizus TaxID=856835 RepID=A0A9P8ARM0_9AGAR|nr:uncharacterized protein BT62DRAFT_898140 [Guyanagaster necrorhizus MCA 3950]KAG7445041.1 hypothetical protein BT62DRAFT_898140 [Guyanagaster necrorhizus MCA 3950]